MRNGHVLEQVLPRSDSASAWGQMRRTLAALAIAAQPVIVAAVLCQTLSGASLSDSIPYYNDEIGYWNQIASFEAVGFGAGYTTVEERPARAAFLPFAPHGPAFPILYGLPARLVGWSYSSGPIFGAVAFIGAAAVWMLVTSTRQLSTAILLISFWPVVLSAPNTMQEMLHFAFACLFAAVSVRLVSVKEPPLRLVVLAACLLIFSSLVRPIWALTALPLAWMRFRTRSRTAACGALLVGGVVVAVLYVTFVSLSAPFPGSPSPLADLSTKPIDAVLRILHRTVVDSPPRWFSLTAEPIEIVFRYELVIVMIVAAVLWFRATTADAERRIHGFILATGLTVFAATLALGQIEAWRDYRATTPLLLMLLLIAASMRSPIVWVAAAMNVLACIPAVATFEDFHAQRFQGDRAAVIERFASEVRGHIRFQAGASRWGNSVLVHVDRYEYPLLGLPRGIGIAGVLSWDRISAPPHSRFLILRQDDLEQLHGGARLNRLATTVLGDLYENPDWSR